MISAGAIKEVENDTKKTEKPARKPLTIETQLIPASVSVSIDVKSPPLSHRIVSTPSIIRRPPSPHSDPGTDRGHVELSRISSLRASGSTADIKKQLRDSRKFSSTLNIPLKDAIKARKILRRQQEMLHLQGQPWYSRGWNKITSGVNWALNFYPENSYSKRFIQTCFAVTDGFGSYMLASGLINAVGGFFVATSTPALIITRTVTGYSFGLVAFKLTLGTIGSHFRSAGYVEERVNAISGSQQNTINLVNTLVHRVNNELKQNEQLRNDIRRGFSDFNTEMKSNNDRAKLLYEKADLLFKQAQALEENSKKLQEDTKKIANEVSASTVNSEVGLRKRNPSHS